MKNQKRDHKRCGSSRLVRDGVVVVVDQPVPLDGSSVELACHQPTRAGLSSPSPLPHKPPPSLSLASPPSLAPLPRLASPLCRGCCTLGVDLYSHHLLLAIVLTHKSSSSKRTLGVDLDARLREAARDQRLGGASHRVRFDEDEGLLAAEGAEGEACSRVRVVQQGAGGAAGCGWRCRGRGGACIFPSGMAPDTPAIACAFARHSAYPLSSSASKRLCFFPSKATCGSFVHSRIVA